MVEYKMETGEKDLYSFPVLSVFFCITVLFFSFFFFFFSFLDISIVEAYNLRPLLLMSQFLRSSKKFSKNWIKSRSELRPKVWDFHFNQHILSKYKKSELSSHLLNFQFSWFMLFRSCFEYSRNKKQLFVYHDFSLINHQVI